MNLKSRLLVGLGSMLIIIIILAGTGINQIRKLNSTIEVIVQNRYQKVELAEVIRIEVANITRELGELILMDNTADMEANINNISQSNTKALTAFANLEKITGLEEQTDTIVQLKDILMNYLQYDKEIIALVRENHRQEAKNILVNDSKRVFNQLSLLVEQINTFEEEKMSESLTYSQQVLNQGIIIFMIFLLAGLVAGILIAGWLIRSISGSLSSLTRALQSVASHGDKSSLPRLSVTSHDEISQISQTFNDMAEALEEYVRKEKESANALQVQNWLKSTVGETTSLVQGVQDLKSFCRLLINQLCSVLRSGYGVFYVCQGERTNQEIVSIASYAGKASEAASLKFRPGEGLIGQCFLDNKWISLTNVPDHYLQVTSGLGQIPPEYLYILPIEFEGKVIGVLELGSFSEFSSWEKEYLEQTRFNIGIALNRIFNHMQVQKLLMESQALTEELQTQSEELQVQQEELKTFNEKLEEQYKNSEEKTLELTKAKVTLEKQAQELAVSAKYKTEFLSNMSHELRTPLNSLLILAKMLADNKEKNLNEKQVEYAETILNSGYDLQNLINDILDLSKIEAGKLEIEAEEVSLEELKQAMEIQFYPLAQKKELDFTIGIDKNLPAAIFTDGHYLKQILKNLLSNAFKFTNHGYVRLSLRKSHGQLAFAVTDTGIGIAKEKQDVIFEAFRQADGTTSRKYGGTGLGLSICRELAALLGGYMQLESQEGEGSTFTLYLPYRHKNAMGVTAAETTAGLEQELDIEVEGESKKDQNQNKSKNENKNESENENHDNAKTGEKTNSSEIDKFESDNLSYVPDSKDKQLKGCKVLIVDDDMRNVFAITAALEELQIEVLFAEHGREALDILQTKKGIDLVLMDIMMPEMDGYEAMKGIRNLPQYADIPIIALTAKAMKGDREKCLHAGASDYISKPLDIKKLVSLLRVWLYR